MAELEAKMDTVLSRLTGMDGVLGKIDTRIANKDTRFAGFDAPLDDLQCEVSGIRLYIAKEGNQKRGMRIAS